MSTSGDGGSRAIIPEDPHADLTERDLARETDRLIDFANGGIRKSDLEREGVANELFRSVFVNESGRVLEPTVHATRLFAAVSAHAGRKLELSEEELPQYYRIGALNQRLGSTRWGSLTWTRKLALLPLVGVKDKLATLRKGVTFASRASITRDELRSWVTDQLPKQLGRGGRPRGPTFGGLSSYAAKGEKLLASIDQVRDRIATAPPKKRKALVQKLRALSQGLAKLVAEFDDEA
jgi:hypothetical protein